MRDATNAQVWIWKTPQRQKKVIDLNVLLSEKINLSHNHGCQNGAVPPGCWITHDSIHIRKHLTFLFFPLKVSDLDWQEKNHWFLQIIRLRFRWTCTAWLMQSLRIPTVEQKPDKCAPHCFCWVWDTLHSLPSHPPYDMSNSVMMAYQHLRAKCTLWLEPAYMPELVSEFGWKWADKKKLKFREKRRRNQMKSLCVRACVCARICVCMWICLVGFFF